MKTKLIGIYKITSPSGRIYIGQSADLIKRIRDYKNIKIGQRKLFYSIKKYGYNNHKFEILFTFPENVYQEVLDHYEIAYIKQYKDNGFKMLNIKEGGKAGKHSEETKQKISKVQKGKILSEETKKKMSQSRKGSLHWNYGNKMNPESIKKISNSRKGKKTWMFGKKHTEESMNKKRIILYKLNELKEIIDIFQGLDKAALSVNGCSPNLIRAIKNNRLYKGFYWKREKDEK